MLAVSQLMQGMIVLFGKKFLFKSTINWFTKACESCHDEISKSLKHNLLVEAYYYHPIIFHKMKCFQLVGTLNEYFRLILEVEQMVFYV